MIFSQTVFGLVMVLVWDLAWLVPFAQAADQPQPLTTVQDEQGKGAAGGWGTSKNEACRSLRCCHPTDAAPRQGADCVLGKQTVST